MSDDAAITKPTVCVVGLGFVGLSCFAGFSRLGLPTLGIEKNEHRLREIGGLEGFWIEPEIKTYLQSTGHHLDSIFSHYPECVPADTIIVMMCVGTPQASDGSADISMLSKAISECLDHFENKKLEIVIKSTVPPGTLGLLETKFSEDHGSNDVCFVSNPEFLREGSAFEDFNNPDRLVIGVNSQHTLQIENIYRENFDGVFRTNSASAEFSKYFSNAALSVMISYANEMRMFGDCMSNIDLNTVFEQFQRDRRWLDGSMAKYFWPGIGFGGYCLPKDTRALSFLMENFAFKGKVLAAGIAVNDELIRHFAETIVLKFAKHERVVLLGSSFKVGSDDIRMSKTTELITRLKKISNFEIALLRDIASEEIATENDFVSLLDASEIKVSDGVVVVLRDPCYQQILSAVPESNVLNIPLL